MEPRKRTEIDPKIDSTSLRMDARSLPGDLRERLSGIFGASGNSGISGISGLSGTGRSGRPSGRGPPLGISLRRGSASFRTHRALTVIFLLIITRVKMYVCFGFSLACLRRARTIDLQCQSLCLCRAFLLRSVCLSCMSVSVSRSLTYVEQGRSTCNVNRYLSVERFCFAACACHCT